MFKNFFSKIKKSTGLLDSDVSKEAHLDKIGLIREELEKIIDPNECIMIESVILPIYKDGLCKELELDILLLTTSAIFCISKMDVNGHSVSGDKNAEEWIITGRKDTPIQNPLIKANNQASMLCSALGIDNQLIIPIVVLFGTSMIDSNSNNVSLTSGLRDSFIELAKEANHFHKWEELHAYEEKIERIRIA